MESFFRKINKRTLLTKTTNAVCCALPYRVLRSVRIGLSEAPACSHGSYYCVYAESPTQKAYNLPREICPVLPGTAV